MLRIQGQTRWFDESVLRISLLSLLSLLSLFYLGCKSPTEEPAGRGDGAQIEATQTPVPTATPRPPEKLELEGGVVVDVVQWGAGALATDGDAVRLHYRLADAEGAVLDDTRDRKGVYEVILGEAEALPGLDLALRRLPAGSLAKVHLPASSAFADRGYADIIPPGTDLWLEIEVLEIVPANSPDSALDGL